MTIKMHKGYWTIFNQGKPVLSCASFREAWAHIYAIYAELDT